MRLSKKAWFWDDERSIGNSLIVTLKYGWCFEPETHVMGFDTVKDAKEAVRDAKPCRCEECVEELKKC